MSAVSLPREVWHRQLRQRLLKRSSNCRYCGRRMSRRTSTLDHVVPRAAGGTSARSNLALVCKGCNEFKADRSLLQLTAWLARVAFVSAIARVGKGVR